MRDDPSVTEAAAPCGASPALVVHLDAPLPAAVEVGNGHVLYLTGRCYHSVRTLTALSVVIDGVTHAIRNHSQVRADVPSADPAIADRVPNSLTSGFWAALPLPKVTTPRRVELAWHAELDDGSALIAPLGTLEVRSSRPRPTTRVTAAESRVAICLATYNPEPTFFAEQIDSIIAQGHRDWTCIVSDDGSRPDRLAAIRAITGCDPRFRVVAHESRLGYYGNFERALREVPDDADFVALADQDDVWYPDKLARTVVAFRAETTLVYCDMDLVARDRAPIAGTYWTTRRNNFTDLASLVFANTVTGAASVFRAALLDDVLPFPPRIGEASHDHWIACAALAKGPLGYVDAPLYAYRQHRDNALGHYAPPPHRLLPRWAELRRVLGRTDLRGRVMAELWRRRDVYVNDVVRLIVIAKILLLRMGLTMTVAKQQTLERIAALEHSPGGLVRESLAAMVERRPTLGAEKYCLRGVVAARVLDWHYRRQRRRLFEERVVRRELTGGEVAVSATAALALIDQKLAPLRLRRDEDAPERVNVIAPAIDFAHLFAGYFGKLNLALRLSDAGHRVRLVIVDPCEHDPAAWRRGIASYPGLEAFFDRVEVAYAADRTVQLPVHPRDTFIATTWWTAHLAHRATRELGRTRFVYLVQEYEPMTFPMGSFHALAAESYALPHCALFSTELLRDYFRIGRIGVYANSAVDGEGASLAFENAIATFRVSPEQLARPDPKRLLFYARPEQHAARNMFELGVLGLREAVTRGAFAAEGWVLEGIGAGRAFAPVELGSGRRLTLLPRVSLAEYHALLPAYDVGLSLMLTPHPSLVPLEMAAAGLVTVTNTYANKSAAALQALSTNLLPVTPTIGGVAGGLCAAAAQAQDLSGRAAGADVAWSRDWRTSFDDEFLRRVGAFLRAV